MYAVFVTPQPLTEPGPIGYVLATGWLQAHHRAAGAVKNGFEITLKPLWALEAEGRKHT